MPNKLNLTKTMGIQKISPNTSSITGNRLVPLVFVGWVSPSYFDQWQVSPMAASPPSICQDTINRLLSGDSGAISQRLDPAENQLEGEYSETNGYIWVHIWVYMSIYWYCIYGYAIFLDKWDKQQKWCFDHQKWCWKNNWPMDSCLRSWLENLLGNPSTSINDVWLNQLISPN